VITRIRCCRHFADMAARVPAAAAATATTAAAAAVAGVTAVRLGRLRLGINTQVFTFMVGEHAMVDAGPSVAWSQLRARLTADPATLAGLRTIALTHHHEDHSGCASQVLRMARAARRTAVPPLLASVPSQRLSCHGDTVGAREVAPLAGCALAATVVASETRVVAHPVAADLVARGFPIQWYRRLVWGVAQPWTHADAPTALSAIAQPSLLLPAVPSTPAPIATVASLGDVAARTRSLLPHDLSAWAAAHTRLHDGSWASLIPVASPGHCEDHVMYYVPERRWLFSGDALVTPRPRMAFHAEDVAAMIRSLADIVRTFDGLVDVVFCAHRGVLAGGMALLAERLRSGAAC